MSTEKLIHMANQIAGFFRSYPEDQAIKGIHDHLMAFWTPRMRATLAACASRGDDKLDQLVVRALLVPQKGSSPIQKEVAGPAKVGQLGSDAG